MRGNYGEYGWTDLHRRSHGESFLWVVLERFVPGSLYLLDEPESALSPARQLALIARMHQLAATDAQFIVASHSPILLGYPGAKIVELGPSGWREVSWHETEPYQLMRRFLADRDSLLKPLLCNDPPR